MLYADLLHTCASIIKEEEKTHSFPWIKIEAWRTCSFTFRIADSYYYIYFGAPGKIQKNYIEFDDRVFSTDNPFQATLYLCAHEMAHWATSVHHNVMKHDDLWRKYYFKYVDVLEKNVRKPDSAEKQILQELKDHQELRKRRIREYISYALLMAGHEELVKKVKTCKFEDLNSFERRIIFHALVRHNTKIVTMYWESLYMAECILTYSLDHEFTDS